jgi:hypothetical protein
MRGNIPARSRFWREVQDRIMTGKQELRLDASSIPPKTPLEKVQILYLVAGSC